MKPKVGLDNWIGRRVNVFAPPSIEHEDQITAGWLVGIKDDWIFLALREGGEPAMSLNLGHVGLIALQLPDEEADLENGGRQLKAMDGGKVHRLRPEGDKPS